MGTSFLPQSTQTFINDQMNNLHATFGRPIVIYRTATQIIIDSKPDNNYMFGGAPSNSETMIIQSSGIFLARVLYGKKQDLAVFDNARFRGSSEQNNLFLQEGEARLKLDPTGAAFIEGCENVVFDGNIMTLVQSKRPHSVIGPPNFFDFYVKKLN